MSPLFRKKKPPARKAYRDYPLGLRACYIQKDIDALAKKDDDRWMSYQKECNRILGIFADRNGHGIELEKQGRMDEAITVYESNIADWADTPYPYKRLRIIYTKRKQYDDAIRVCQKYIDTTRGL